MAHPHKHKAKSKRKSILRRFASDNRVKGLFVVVSVLLIGVGYLAIQQKQIYKSEAASLASCTKKNCESLGSGTSCNADAPSNNHGEKVCHIDTTCWSNCCKSKAGFNIDGPKYAYYNCGNGARCDHNSMCTSNKCRGNICVSSSSPTPRPTTRPTSTNCTGGNRAADCTCSTNSQCASNRCGGGGGRIPVPKHCIGGQYCNIRNSAPRHGCPSGFKCERGDGVGGTCVRDGGGSGGGGGDCAANGGVCFNPAEKRCGPADDPGKHVASARTCGNSSNKCCSSQGVAQGLPKGKDSAGGGASTDPSTPSQFDDGGLGGNNTMGTGVTANNGGGSSSSGGNSPAGKSHDNCSVSQKPSTLTPSGTVKPGSKTLRWSAVSKVTKYKVTVNSTARDVTGTSMPFTVKDKKTYNIKVQAYICGKAGNAKTATIKGDVSAGGTTTPGACKAAGTQCGQGGGANPGSQCCSKVCTDGKCAAEGTPTEDPDVSPTEVPVATTNATLKISLRFQGLNTSTSKKFLSEKTQITLINTKTKTIVEPKTVDFRIVDAIRWMGEAHFPSIPSEGGYIVAVKGPQHVQRLVCEASPSESTVSINSLYKCERDEDDHQIGNIILTRGANVLNFAGITQFAGDVPEQDGVIDSLDLANVRQSLGSTETDALEMADLNLDGVVNTADFSMVIQALDRYRADEIYTGASSEEDN